MKKIELWYDSILTKTTVSINEQKQTGDYAFLREVNSYPLQAWLQPNDVWPGLRAKLLKLARGDRIALVFYGREIDFVDVEQSLSGMEKLTLRFEPWESSVVSKIYALAAQLSKKFPIEAFPIAPPKEEQLGGTGWLNRIQSDADFAASVENPEGCYCVTEGFLTETEKLRKLSALTDGMCVPQDAICCVFETEKKRDAFKRYAEQLNTRYRFAFNGTGGDWAEEKQKLKEKYGDQRKSGTVLQEERAIYEPYIREIKNRCAKRQELFDKLIALVQIEQDQKLSKEDVQRKEDINKKINWIDNISCNKEYNQICSYIAELKTR